MGACSKISEQRFGSPAAARFNSRDEDAFPRFCSHQMSLPSTQTIMFFSMGSVDRFTAKTSAGEKTAPQRTFGEASERRDGRGREAEDALLRHRLHLDLVVRRVLQILQCVVVHVSVQNHLKQKQAPEHSFRLLI